MYKFNYNLTNTLRGVVILVNYGRPGGLHKLSGSWAR